MVKGLTPAMKQFFEIKQRYPDAILLFRMGDFYETFGEDAKLASEVLGIILTTREKGKENPIPMAGFPYHAAKNYITKLVRAGYKVAICEQLEDPSQAKGLVKRGVVEVITPGSFLEEGYIPERKSADVLFVYPAMKGSGDDFSVYISWADVSTGRFSAVEVDSIQSFIDTVSRVEPLEIVFPYIPQKVSSFEAPLKDFSGFLRSRIRAYFPDIPIFEHPYRIEQDITWYSDRFRALLGVRSLKGYGIEEDSPLTVSLLYLFSYLVDYQMKPLRGISLEIESPQGKVLMNEGTYRHLEIARLSEVLDNTATPMGGRLLRDYLKNPVSSIREIERRQEFLKFFMENLGLARDIHASLRGVPDLQRLLYRFVLHRGTPYDAYRLLKGARVVLDVYKKLKSYDVRGLESEFEKLLNFSGVVRVLEGFLKDEILPGQNEDFVKEGYDEELDRYRRFSRRASEVLKEIQDRERRRTGIQNLKIGYNKVFGYYIEVPKSQISRVPGDYIRKQTLVSYERYTFPELQRVEAEILEAGENFSLREKELFKEVSEELAQLYTGLKGAFEVLSTVDLYSSHAIFAFEKNYVIPEIVEEKVLRIKNGRHPLVEGFIDEPFVPNDTHMDEKRFFYLITGPNMAGKSTYIRQVGIIVLLAHSGFAVPADEATVGLMDALFTRVGASDNLSRGESTFFSEMLEVAQILNRSTEKSIVILDEVGRGTSTLDGEAIARAVAEDLHNRVKARTFFATHYHELTDLEDYLDGVVNYTFAVEKWRGEVIFLKKLIKGRSTRSYGIEVAAMAGVPPHVIERARELLLAMFREGATGRVETPVGSDRIEASEVSSRAPKERVREAFLPLWENYLKEKGG